LSSQKACLNLRIAALRISLSDEVGLLSAKDFSASVVVEALPESSLILKPNLKDISTQTSMKEAKLNWKSILSPSVSLTLAELGLSHPVEEV